MATESFASFESGLTLSYAERGAGRAIVMLPGPTDSWRSYEAVVEEMPESIRVIAVSQRGHGDSDKPSTGYRVDDYAADVEALLDALDIDRAVVVGHSGSCFVARRFAIDHPDRVAGLVLEASPTALTRDPALTELVESVISKLSDPIDPEFVREFVTGTSARHIPSATIDLLTDEAMKVPAVVWRETFAGLLQYDDVVELGRIIAPTLLLWGDADELVSWRMQDNLLHRVASGRLVVLRGLGHTPRWEDPKRFAAEVAAFVDGLPR